MSLIDEVKWHIGDIDYIRDIKVKWYDEYKTADLEDESQIIIEIIGQNNDKIYESCPDFVTTEFAIKTPVVNTDIEWYKSVISECVDNVEHSLHPSRLQRYAEKIKLFVDNKLTRFDYSDISKWKVYANGTAFPHLVLFRTNDGLKKFVYAYNNEYIEYDSTFTYPSVEDINKALSEFIKSNDGKYIMDFYNSYKKLIEG